MDNDLRRKVWPIIFCMKDSDLKEDQKINGAPSEEILRKLNEGKTTIKKDANRSFVNFKEIGDKSRFVL